MKVIPETTRRALMDLNLRFYRRHAASFNSTRGSPWNGWARIADLLPADARSPLRVLDLGCGNGRLAEYLVQRCSIPIEYLGVDSSQPLLAAARQRLGRWPEPRLQASLIEVDTTTPSLPHHLGAERFDLVALFGVLHHVPGLLERRDLVRRAASLLAPGGILALSIWRHDQSAHFHRKVIPWEEYYRERPRDFALGDLEDGDYLLSWTGDRETPRYCHFATDQEISALTSAVDQPCVARFSADGKDNASNLYLVFGDGTT